MNGHEYSVTVYPKEPFLLIELRYYLLLVSSSGPLCLKHNQKQSTVSTLVWPLYAKFTVASLC